MADDKKNDFADAVAIATKVAVEAFQNGQRAVAAPHKAFCLPTGQQCPDCAQPAFITEKGLKFSCGGKHAKMTVLPQETNHFPGLCLNGVWYKSQDGRPITVPAENDFQEMLNKWDVQEREAQTGRKIRPSSYNPITRPPKADTQA